MGNQVKVEALTKNYIKKYGKTFYIDEKRANELVSCGDVKIIFNKRNVGNLTWEDVFGKR